MSTRLEKYLKKKFEGIELTEVVDIVLFGSVVKGKEFPRDVDICVIFRSKVDNKIINKISSRLKKADIHISSLAIDDFFRKPHSLIKTILLEGKSILTGKRIINNFGFSSAIIYSYDLSNLKQSKKVRFVYLLKGRDGRIGTIKKIGGEWLADSCFIVPLGKDNDISSIFKKWGVEYKKKEALLH